MHVHVPKPLHGWKAFFNEILVIVIGVLIALGLEQGVEWAHWQHKVHDGRERLAIDVARLFSDSVEITTLAPCWTAQLATLKQQVLTSGTTLTPVPLVPSVPPIGREHVIDDFHHLMGVFPSYDLLAADGTLAHFSPAEQNMLSAIRFHVERSSHSESDYANLVAMASPLPLDPATRYALVAEIVRATDSAQTNASSAGQLMAATLRVSLALDREALAAKALAARASQIEHCRKLGYPLGDWHKMVGFYATRSQFPERKTP